MRGRPPVTRARVLSYIQRNNPATVMQVCRALQVDRSSVYRILRAVYGPNFRQRWHDSEEMDQSLTEMPFAA